MNGKDTNTFPEIPEEVRALMEQDALPDNILLDKNGNWFHNGEPFINERIIRFFNGAVNRTADGTYVLHYDRYTWPITVEDVPVFITGVRVLGYGPFEEIILNLSTGEEEKLDADTLYYKDNNALYCKVHGGRLPAKFQHSPSFQVLERLDEIDGLFYLSICGKIIQLRKED